MQERAVTAVEFGDDFDEGKVVVPAAVVKIFHVLVAFAVIGVQERVVFPVEVDWGHAESGA